MKSLFASLLVCLLLACSGTTSSNVEVGQQQKPDPMPQPGAETTTSAPEAGSPSPSNLEADSGVLSTPDSDVGSISSPVPQADADTRSEAGDEAEAGSNVPETADSALVDADPTSGFPVTAWFNCTGSESTNGNYAYAATLYSNGMAQVTVATANCNNSAYEPSSGLSGVGERVTCAGIGYGINRGTPVTSEDGSMTWSASGTCTHF